MIVVGTGPAGLTAAYLLRNRGHAVTLIDFADEPGGLWAGWNDKGRHFERGMHNYMTVAATEIDEFFCCLPGQRHLLEGNARDTAGVYHRGKLYQHSPSIDVVDDPNHKQIVSELLWNAFSPPPASDRAIDRAVSQFGETATRTHIMPTLKKIYGTTQLRARALDLTNLHRLVVSHDETVVEDLIVADPLRARIAWPNQHTLPKSYSSGRDGFYPAEGMKALVAAAIAELTEMGVEIKLGINMDDGNFFEPELFQPTVWAAGLPRLAKELHVNYPPVEARTLTVVNLAGNINAGPLHYFYCYEEQLKTFRVTCYANFSFFQQVSVELLGVNMEDAADVAIAELTGMGLITKHTGKPEVVGVHEIPNALVLPTSNNDNLLDHLRLRLRRDNLHLVGSGARNGLFFQPDVLRHVWHTVHLNIGTARP